jgi:hypothetical protein
MLPFTLFMDIDKIIGPRLADKSAVGAINRPLRLGWVILFICINRHTLTFPVFQACYSQFWLVGNDLLAFLRLHTLTYQV